MPDQSDLEQRLRAVEVRLRGRRRVAVALVAVCLVGLLGAARAPRPEVLRVQRIEVVDDGGQVLGGFGIGALSHAMIAGREVEQLGWRLQDPISKARASARVDCYGTATAYLGSDGASTAFMAQPTGAAVSLGAKGHDATLVAKESQSCVWFNTVSGWEPVLVLALSCASGRPRIQGWESGLPAFDIH